MGRRRFSLVGSRKPPKDEHETSTQDVAEKKKKKKSKKLRMSLSFNNSKKKGTVRRNKTENDLTAIATSPSTNDTTSSNVKPPPPPASTVRQTGDIINANDNASSGMMTLLDNESDSSASNNVQNLSGTVTTSQSLPTLVYDSDTSSSESSNINVNVNLREDAPALNGEPSTVSAAEEKETTNPSPSADANEATLAQETSKTCHVQVTSNASAGPEPDTKEEQHTSEPSEQTTTPEVHDVEVSNTTVVALIEVRNESPSEQPVPTPSEEQNVEVSNTSVRAIQPVLASSTCKDHQRHAMQSEDQHHDANNNTNTKRKRKKRMGRRGSLSSFMERAKGRMGASSMGHSSRIRRTRSDTAPGLSTRSDAAPPPTLTNADKTTTSYARDANATSEANIMVRNDSESQPSLKSSLPSTQQDPNESQPSLKSSLHSVSASSSRSVDHQGHAASIDQPEQDQPTAACNTNPRRRRKKGSLSGFMERAKGMGSSSMGHSSIRRTRSDVGTPTQGLLAPQAPGEMDDSSSSQSNTMDTSARRRRRRARRTNSLPKLDELRPAAAAVVMAPVVVTTAVARGSVHATKTVVRGSVTAVKGGVDAGVNAGGAVLRASAKAGHAVVDVGAKAGTVVVNTGTKAGQAVVEAGTMAGQAVVGAGTMAGKTVVGAGTAVVNTGAKAGQAVANTGAKATQAVVGAGTMAGQAVVGAGTAVVSTGAKAGTMATQAVVGAGTAVVNSGAKAGTMATQAVVGAGTMAGQAVVGAGTVVVTTSAKAGQAVVGAGTAVVNTGAKAGAMATQAVVGAGTMAGQAVVGAGTAVANTKAGQAVAAAGTAVANTKAGQVVVGAGTMATNAVVGAGTMAGQAVVGAGTAVVNTGAKAGQAVVGGGKLATQAVVGAGAAVVGAGAKAGHAVVDAGNKATKTVVGAGTAVVGAGTAVVGASTRAGQAVVGAGGRMVYNGGRKFTKGMRRTFARGLGMSTRRKKSTWEEGIEVIDGLLDPSHPAYGAITEEERQKLANVKKFLLKGPGKGDDLKRQHIPQELLQMQDSALFDEDGNPVANAGQKLARQRNNEFLLQEYGGLRDRSEQMDDLSQIGSDDESEDYMEEERDKVTVLRSSTNTLSSPDGQMDQDDDDDVSISLFSHRTAHTARQMFVLDKAYLPPEFTYMDCSAQVELAQMLSWESLMSWDFDIFRLNEITNGHPLLFMSWAIISAPYAQQAMAKELNQSAALNEYYGYGFMEELSIPTDRLCNYMRTIEGDYNDFNPYHNAIHAADVLQTTHTMIQKAQGEVFMEHVSNIKKFAVLLAAAVHDVQHPGKNNAFHVKLRTELAVNYNDNSVLENHHAAQAFARMLNLDLKAADDLFDGRSIRARRSFMADENSDNNILCNVTSSQFETIRKLMIDAVLQTDMTSHFSMVNEVRAMLMDTEEVEEEKKADHAWRVLTFMLHMCDISGQAKGPHLFRKWGERCMEEFFLQGDEERELGLSISPNCDRETVIIAESQVGFVNFVVIPSYEVLGKHIAFVEEEVLPIVHDNLDYWCMEAGGEEVSDPVAKEAASTIQSAWRQRMATRQGAATKIQARLRGWFLRQTRTHAATALQRAWRKRKATKARHMAASKIQALARGGCLRASMHRRKSQAEQLAASKIQARIRGSFLRASLTQSERLAVVRGEPEAVPDQRPEELQAVEPTAQLDEAAAAEAEMQFAMEQLEADDVIEITFEPHESADLLVETVEDDSDDSVSTALCHPF